MSTMKVIAAFNEMDHILDRFKRDEITKQQALMKLADLFDEMKAGECKPEKTQKKKKVAEKKDPAPQTLASKLAAGAKDFLFNPERNKGKREQFGGSGGGMNFRELEGPRFQELKPPRFEGPRF